MFRNRIGITLFLEVLLAMAVTACSDGSSAIPPPDEVGPRITAVRDAVWANEAALKQPIESHLNALEATIDSIAKAHGEQSVEAVQAVAETSSMLGTKDRWDLALPFMERALVLSRDKSIELQAALFQDVEMPKARGLQESAHEHRN